jgi:hypothetical protein
MEDTVFTLLLKEISEKREAIKEHLAGGGATTFEAYCLLVGEYSSLVRVEDDIKRLEERFIAN